MSENKIPDYLKVAIEEWWAKREKITDREERGEKVDYGYSDDRAVDLLIIVGNEIGVIE